MLLLRLVWAIVHALFAKKPDLVAENLALRQQLIVFRRKIGRPRLRRRDRIFWLWLARSWDGWRDTLIVVKPTTVVRWHRQGFKYYWAWKSRHKGGRPAVAPEVRNLIRHRKPPSPSWRAFLDNHLKSLVSIDFFTVPAVRFRILFVFLVLSHDRRRIVHFNVTEHPSAEWTGRQLVAAFPWDTVPRYLIRDRDGIYGQDFTRCVHAVGIKQVLIAPRSPWQNPFVERLIGTLRRDCLDHVMVLNANHLRRLVREYLAYYHGVRTHLALEKDSPEPRKVESPDQGKIVEFPMVGGLHHRYSRLAA